MTTESMRERFEAWYDAFELRRVYDKYGPSGAAFEVWQAATLAERERCSKICDVQWTLTSGHVAKQCAEAIRKG